jgi:hypothetical protein
VEARSSLFSNLLLVARDVGAGDRRIGVLEISSKEACFSDSKIPAKEAAIESNAENFSNDGTGQSVAPSVCIVGGRRGVCFP